MQLGLIVCIVGAGVVVCLSATEFVLSKYCQYCLQPDLLNKIDYTGTESDVSSNNG